MITKIQSQIPNKIPRTKAEEPTRTTTTFLSWCSRWKQHNKTPTYKNATTFLRWKQPNKIATYINGMQNKKDQNSTTTTFPFDDSLYPYQWNAAMSIVWTTKKECPSGKVKKRNKKEIKQFSLLTNKFVYYIFTQQILADTHPPKTIFFIICFPFFFGSLSLFG